VARRLAALTCSVLDCRRVGIVAVDPETRLVRPVAVVGLSAERESRWWAEQEQQQVRFGEGADPALVERFAAGETLVGGAWPAPDGVATGLFVPLRLGETLIGMLSLDFGDAPHAFTEDERALAATVAKLAALVLERERLLREREQARAGELAQREANRRMDLFLGMASHELKTPITALLVNLQMVARRLYPSLPRAARYDPATALDAARTQLDRAERAVRRLDRLVGDLLDASRVREDRLAFRPAPCDLLAIVRDAVEEQRQIAPGRHIALDAPSLPALPLLADADRIGQVVTNFLTNALRYSAPGRPVTVTVTPDGSRARVAVRDEGPGLPPVEQERVWERFHRAPDVSVLSGSGVGLGLGLYITRTVVEWHGGRVGVESAPGRGSTFWFEIPLAAAGKAGGADETPAGGHGRAEPDGTHPDGAGA
jgi:signal transduction histidine kinase